MNTELSFSDRVIKEAKDKGYIADAEGNIFSPRGKILKGGRTKQGYRTFTPAAYPDNKRGCILQHRFIAYFFLGDEVFNHRCVRHKNDIPVDNKISNLLLGSYQDNSLDMPIEKRKSRSKGAKERIVEQNRKLTNEQIISIRKLRDEQELPYYKIAKLYKISTMTAYRAATKKSWSEV